MRHVLTGLVMSSPLLVCVGAASAAWYLTLSPRYPGWLVGGVFKLAGVAWLWGLWLGTEIRHAKSAERERRLLLQNEALLELVEQGAERMARAASMHPCPGGSPQ